MTFEERATILRIRGATPLRIFRVLKREYPAIERDVLWKAAGAGPTGIMPMWAEHGSAPASARIRNDPRKF